MLDSLSGWRAALLLVAAALFTGGFPAALTAQESGPTSRGAAPEMEKDDAGLPWLLKIEAAKSRAKAEGKDLFINFTGSDWCHWCKRLDEEVFAHAAFQEGAGSDYVFLYLDFPMSDEAKEKVVDAQAAEALRMQFGVQGFPTIFLTDAEGNPYARTGYQPGGPEAYKTHLTELRSGGAKVKALLRSGDPEQRQQLLVEAFPILLSQELLGFEGYSPFVDEAEKIPSLAKPVAAFRANQKLQALLMTQEEPNWEELHAFLLANESLSGPMFLDACWPTATMYLAEKKDFAAAIVLLERMLKDPILAGNEQAKKMIGDKIEEFKSGKSGDHDGHGHGDHDHDHDHDDHDHDGDGKPDHPPGEHGG